jgi:single-strand DNA-binding protein
MSSVNKVLLLGRLGADPETRSTGDTQICHFNLATSSISKKSGERKEFTEWHKCCAFNKAAEVAGQYLKKGSLVFVEGSLRTRKWQDKDGQDRYTTEVIVGRLVLVGSRDAGKDRPDVDDDDIPF